MAVLREWRAEIRRQLKHKYVEYVRRTGIAEYRALPGNLGAVVATRDLDEGRSEIVTLSWWTDNKAIQTFAGDDISVARYFPEDDRFLLTRRDRCTTTSQRLSMRDAGSDMAEQKIEDEEQFSVRAEFLRLYIRV
jgi:hypothetical protein